MPLTTVSPGLLDSTAQYYSFKNRIINGAMGIWQRGTSFTPASNAYTADRWRSINTPNVSRSTDVPSGAGFSYSLLQTITTAVAFRAITQRIESANCTDLVGSKVTVSFWVKADANAISSSSYLALQYANSADDFSSTTTIEGYSFYTELTAGEWKKITFTTTDVLPSGAANGLPLIFAISAASGVANSNMNITGVQLEKGSTATSFDYRPYGTELALCQRYYYLHASGSTKNIGIGAYFSATNLAANISFPVSMRSAPTSAIVSGTNYYIFYRNSASDEVNSFLLEAATTNSTNIYNATEASGTAGQAGYIYTNNASAFLAFQAEL